MNTNENNNALATMEASDIQSIAVQDAAPISMLNDLMNPAASFFTSIADDGTRESKKKIYNAMNAAEKKLDDEKGETILAVDVIAHTLTLADDKTGELVDCVRVVIVDNKGVGHVAVSQGIVSSLTKLFAIVGQPSWNPPLPIKVVEQKTRNGYKTNTLELV